jgi:hypothetical protein
VLQFRDLRLLFNYTCKGIGMGRKKVTLTIDEDVWKRCQFLHRTAGANWSQVAERAFSVVLETFDEMVSSDTLGSSPGTPEFRKDALALLESRYESALEETHQILSEPSPCKVSTHSMGVN